jgi:hypothetical protein
MVADQNPDILRGTWIDANSTDLKAALLVSGKVGILAVVDMSGKETVYTGSNAAAMVGFYKPTNIKDRQPFFNISGVNPYLAPVARSHRIDYLNKGYELAQTEGWPSEL